MKLNHSFILLGLLFVPFASAIDPVIFKLHPSAPEVGSAPAFALSVAANEKYLVVGDSGDDTKAVDAGAVYVFDAKNRKLLRKIYADDAAAGDFFGRAVAVWGTKVVIGAPFDDSTVNADEGSAYVYDLSTGKKLQKLVPAAGQAGDEFGTSVATNGSVALIGAPKDDVLLDADQGSAYVFQLSDGQQLQQIIWAPSAAGDEFGISVALSGNLGLIGAHLQDVGMNPDQGSAHLYDVVNNIRVGGVTANDGAAGDAYGFAVALHGNMALIGAGAADVNANVDQGAAYLYDILTGLEVRKIIAPDGDGGEFFGDAVALNGNNIMIGAPYEDFGAATSAGAVYLFDLISSGTVAKFNAVDAKAADSFGFALALTPSSALIAAIGDDDLGADTGAAYGMYSLSQQLPIYDLVKKGDFAPGVPGALLGSFTTFLINSDRYSLVAGALTGSGSSGGKTKAAWTNLSSTIAPGVVAADELVLGTKVTNILFPTLQNLTHASYVCKISGTGITTANDQILVSDDGDFILPLLQENDNLTLAPFTGQGLASILQVVNSTTATKAAIAASLKNGAITVTGSSNSAVILHDLASDNLLDGIIEGAASPVMGVNYGQINPRVALSGEVYVSSGALMTPTTSTNAAIFASSETSADVVIAQKGNGSPAGGTFKSFLGETVASDGAALFKASLSGLASSVSEGLFTDRGGSPEILAQKGTQAADLPSGVKYGSVIRYWMLQSERALFLIKLTGTGVTTSNDQALFIAFENGTERLLMREGDIAPDCDGGKIGVIQQVDADSETGTFAVITSLTGVASNSNQALWMAEGLLGANLPSIFPREAYVPRLRLRKGSFQSFAGSTSSITSIKMMMPIDSTGAAAKGMGNAAVAGWAALMLTFADGQVLLGSLPQPVSF